MSYSATVTLTCFWRSISGKMTAPCVVTARMLLFFSPHEGEEQGGAGGVMVMIAHVQDHPLNAARIFWSVPQKAVPQCS